LKVLRDLIALEPISFDEEMTSSGIIVTSQISEHRAGRVIAVGPEVHDSVKKGMIVLYEKLMGEEVFHAGRELLFVREDSCFGVCDDYTI